MTTTTETGHYGEQARPWPGGCSCCQEGVGYFRDYRDLFDGWVERVEWERGRLHVFVHDRLDDMGAWVATIGSFSWTPHGDIFDRRFTLLAPNRERATEIGHEAAVNAVHRDEERGNE